MVRKNLFFVLILYILSLLQTSFLVHFNILGIVPNFVLIAVIFINVLSNVSWQEKIFFAVIGGFYLDIFSLNNMGGFFGFYTLILTGLSLFLKNILAKYIRFPVIAKI